jgi:quercetin dioxygenase-like cupin family protein
MMSWVAATSGGAQCCMSIVEHQHQPWSERRPGSRLQVITDPSGAVNALALLHQECEPGVGAPSHTHEFEEILTIVEGAAEVWVDAVRDVIGPGTSVFVRAGAVHGFVNVGDGPLRLDGVIAARELRATFLPMP